VPYLTTLPPAIPAPAADPPHPMTSVCDVTLSRRAFARSLAQTGNAQCLRVLHELAWSVTDQNARADLLLELAELALDYDDDESARNAVNSVTRVLGIAGEPAPGLAEYFAARLARANARLTEPSPQASLKFLEAITWLRRSAAASPNATETYVALFETLGDMTLLEFEAGNFASARAASADAVGIIESFALRTRPRALEVIAMDAALDACLSGHMAAATATVSSLLRRAVDSGWSATASRLGADLVGLGGYDSAIRWYARMWPLAFEGARPNDRWLLTLEAAGTYATAKRPREALAMLNRAKPGVGCPHRGLPSKHAFTAAALLQLGENANALAEARAALRGYAARCSGRGMSDAHRLIARSHAKLGDLRAARENIFEARSLSERYAMPAGLLCTVSTQAEILQSPALKAEAFELERLLRSRASD
jgi:tetratricopeptide (TPR) repeat protein